MKNYKELLTAAAELQSFTGYLDSELRREQAKAQGVFNGERRRFVYDAIKDQKDIGQLKESVSTDLDRIGASGGVRGEVIEFTRQELFKHIDKQAAGSGLQRIVTRWGPPALSVVALLGYAYLQYLRAQ